MSPSRRVARRPFWHRFGLGSHPERMTARARIYLFTTAASHGLIAALCILAPQTFRSPSYEVVVLGAPLWLSGGVYGTASVLCVLAAHRRSVRVARWGLGLSVIATGAWTVGLVAGIFLVSPTGFTGPVVWASLTIKDALQCLAPQRLPLEPVIREVLADDEHGQERAR